MKKMISRAIHSPSMPADVGNRWFIDEGPLLTFPGSALEDPLSLVDRQSDNKDSVWMLAYHENGVANSGKNRLSHPCPWYACGTLK